MLAELPGDSWVAFGAPDFGPALKGIYQQVAGALGGAAIENQLRQELGLDLQQDVFSWIGDVAVFARGTTADTVEGGVVIEVTDPAKAQSAFGKLLGLAQSRGGVRARPVKIDGADAAFEAALPGAPKPVVAARSDDRVVIAFGRDAAADALGGGEKLGDSDTYGAAKSVLGDVEPGFLRLDARRARARRGRRRGRRGLREGQALPRGVRRDRRRQRPRRRHRALADGGAAEVGAAAGGVIPRRPR